MTGFSPQHYPILFRRRWPTTGLADGIEGIDLDCLCAEYDRLRKEAPSRTAAGKRHFVDGHDGCLRTRDPDRQSEKHPAIALFRRRELPRPDGGPQRLLDYEFPLQSSSKDKSLGKVDLLGATDRGRLVVVELKIGEDSPVLALMQGLRYAAIVHANLRAIAEEAGARFNINLSDGPPIVQILGTGSWWSGWCDMSESTREKTGRREPRFLELTARLEDRLGIAIECALLEGTEPDDVTWDACGPVLGHTPRLYTIHLEAE